jgi:hypothetical protein
MTKDSYFLPPDEIRYLQGLARRMKAISELPVMNERRQLWTDMNDGKSGARPPVVIEADSFDRDFLPESMLWCKTAYGRKLEKQFLHPIRYHEVLNDDHVCPGIVQMDWHIAYDEFGIKMETTYARDCNGEKLGFHVEHPIKDLDDGFDRIQPAAFSVDRDGTAAEKAFLEDVFGSILPVEIHCSEYGGSYARNFLTQRLLELMSMETLFMAMYDCPDKLHAIMALMRDNAVRMARWAEKEGLLTLNNGNQSTCGSCYNFTTLLPKEKVPGPVRLADLWTSMNSQESVGVSPELFHEFFFPYFRDLAEMYGLVYWGCCEPADPIWESSLSKLPNLKAVSISPWADQEFMADALKGTGIVYSRKPTPNLLGVDEVLNEAAWSQHIRETLEFTVPAGVPTEFVVRDVYTVHGNLNKPARAVELARREINRFFG